MSEFQDEFEHSLSRSPNDTSIGEHQDLQSFPISVTTTNNNNSQQQSSSSNFDDDQYASSLFLGDLSVYSTEKDIRQLFRNYGIIDRIRIKRGGSGKPHLSYGFIKFRDRESAERALNELNGTVFLGRALRIGWAEPKNQVKIPKAPKIEELNTAQIHVSYISKQIDVLISEATLRSIFELFGPVVDVAIKKSQFDKKLKLQNGYGFVHFILNQEGIQAAVDATHNVHQVTVDRVTYDCSLSHSLYSFNLPSPRTLPNFPPKGKSNSNNLNNLNNTNTNTNLYNVNFGSKAGVMGGNRSFSREVEEQPFPYHVQQPLPYGAPVNSMDLSGYQPAVHSTGPALSHYSGPTSLVDNRFAGVSTHHSMVPQVFTGPGPTSDDDRYYSSNNSMTASSMKMPNTIRQTEIYPHLPLNPMEIPPTSFPYHQHTNDIRSQQQQQQQQSQQRFQAPFHPSIRTRPQHHQRSSSAPSLNVNSHSLSSIQDTFNNLSVHSQDNSANPLSRKRSDNSLHHHQHQPHHPQPPQHPRHQPYYYGSRSDQF